jgi:hypothetical protein
MPSLAGAARSGAQPCGAGRDWSATAPAPAPAPPPPPSASARRAPRAPPPAYYHGTTCNGDPPPLSHSHTGTPRGSPRPPHFRRLWKPFHVQPCATLLPCAPPPSLVVYQTCRLLGMLPPFSHTSSPSLASSCSQVPHFFGSLRRVRRGAGDAAERCVRLPPPSTPPWWTATAPPPPPPPPPPPHPRLKAPCNCPTTTTPHSSLRTSPPTADRHVPHHLPQSRLISASTTREKCF